MPADYGYLNARIRAMKSRLLDARLYNELLAKTDLNDLLASLARTGYGGSMAAALARYSGWDALRDGLRQDLVSSLRKVHSMVMDAPASEPAQLVRSLLARWDRNNLFTVIRAHSHGAATPLEMDILVPAGELDIIALEELVRQPDLRAAVDLLSTWGLPYAAALGDAMPRATETGDPAVLENVLDQRYAAVLQEQLDTLPDSESVVQVRRILGLELDQRNLLTALRLRGANLGGDYQTQEALRNPEPLAAWHLPGGALSERVLTSLLTMPTTEEVCTTLAVTPAATPWRSALEAWCEHGSLPKLQDALERRLTELAIGLFYHNPLSIAPIIAYLWAKENEVRNLRLIGMGILQGSSKDLILEDLYMPW